MKERPILFSEAMVRAILDGKKFQTRRAMKPQPVPARLTMGAAASDECIGPLGGLTFADKTPGTYRCVGGDTLWKRCPYGVIGDRLWVRETHLRSGDDVMYADDADYDICYPNRSNSMNLWRVVPSIFMRRESSRLTLELTQVRAERLNVISDADALAEGVRFDGVYFLGGIHRKKHTLQCWPTAARAYQAIWETINGPKSWAVNPWVWVIEFREIPLMQQLKEAQSA